jgi:hypothetical protein
MLFVQLRIAGGRSVGWVAGGRAARRHGGRGGGRPASAGSGAGLPQQDAPRRRAAASVRSRGPLSGERLSRPTESSRSASGLHRVASDQQGRAGRHHPGRRQPDLRMPPSTKSSRFHWVSWMSGPTDIRTTPSNRNWFLRIFLRSSTYCSSPSSNKYPHGLAMGVAWDSHGANLRYPCCNTPCDLGTPANEPVAAATATPAQRPAKRHPSWPPPANNTDVRRATRSKHRTSTSIPARCSQQLTQQQTSSAAQQSAQRSGAAGHCRVADAGGAGRAPRARGETPRAHSTPGRRGDERRSRRRLGGTAGRTARRGAARHQRRATLPQRHRATRCSAGRPQRSGARSRRGNKRLSADDRSTSPRATSSDSVPAKLDGLTQPCFPRPMSRKGAAW